MDDRHRAPGGTVESNGWKQWFEAVVENNGGQEVLYS
jgi:hypothetical protein